jgi:hypothetical protein
VSHCPECDRPLLWGGMSSVPHTDAQHAADRARLLRYAARLLRERIAASSGHRIVLRFTADAAWFECACGASGLARVDSAYARRDGHQHLVGEA